MKNKLSAAHWAIQFSYVFFGVRMHFLSAFRTHMPIPIYRRRTKLLPGCIWPALYYSILSNKVIQPLCHCPAPAIACVKNLLAIHIAVRILQSSVQQSSAEFPPDSRFFCPFANGWVSRSNAEKQFPAFTTIFAFVCMPPAHITILLCYAYLFLFNPIIAQLLSHIPNNTQACKTIIKHKQSASSRNVR